MRILILNDGTQHEIYRCGAAEGYLWIGLTGETDLRNQGSAFKAEFSDQSVRQATAVPGTGNAPGTREEALQYIVPLKGEWFGHPLGEVFAKSPRDVQFYSTCRHADLRTAAKLVMSK